MKNLKLILFVLDGPSRTIMVESDIAKAGQKRINVEGIQCIRKKLTKILLEVND